LLLLAAAYEPAAQGKQRTTGGLEYSPGPQKAQSSEAEFEFEHGRHADLPLAPYDPTAQSEHGSEPFVGLYFAATQAMQLPIVPEKPTLQEQLAMLSLPTDEYVFSGHDWHSVLLPTEYVLAAQFIHVSVAEFR